MDQSSGEINRAPASAPTSDEIRSQIEDTRAEMSETIDAIQARLSPRRLITDTTETVKEATVGRVKRLAQGGHPGNARWTLGHLMEVARDNPIPVALTSVAAATVLVRAMRRANSRAGTPVQRRIRANGSGRTKARVLAAAGAGLACWGAFRARRPTETV